MEVNEQNGGQEDKGFVSYMTLATLEKTSLLT